MMKRTLPLFQVLRQHPLFPQVDLTRAINRYVLVDPINPSTLLYVTEKVYLRLVAVALSNDETLTTVITPGDIVVAGPDGRPLITPLSPDDSSTSSGGSSITPESLVQSSSPILPLPILEWESEVLGQWKDYGQYISDGDLHDIILESQTRNVTYDRLTEYYMSLVSSTQSWYHSTTPIGLMSKPVRKPFYLRGSLKFHTRCSDSPNFLEARTDNIGPIMREWGLILYIRILGRVPNEYSITMLLAMNSHLKSYAKSRGILTTLQYMKCSYLYCVAYLAGTRHSDSWIFGTPVGLSGGLPKWLPAGLRLQLRKGDLRIWRWLLSYLFSYKGLIAPAPKPTLSSITGPSWDITLLKGIEEDFKPFYKYVISQYKDPLPSLSPPQPYHRSWYEQKGASVHEAMENTLELLTSGPNGRPSVAKAGLDALAWYSKGDTVLVDWLVKTKNYLTLALYQASLQQALTSTKFYKPWSAYPPTAADVSDGWYLHRSQSEAGISEAIRKVSSLTLGRLSLKPEAAGKVRVFAIADYWTQCALSSLHRMVFSLLEKLPGDATIDQSLVFQAFCSVEHKSVTCYDLSNATDILSTKIQVGVLSEFITPELALLWESLLCNREYTVPSGTACPTPTVKYSRGQPIGALSSWAMLALTHHFLVFVAARRAGLSTYTDYVICGDDIALGGDQVPTKYLQLCQELEIPISIPKSLSSTDEQVLGDIKGPLTSFVSRLSAGSVDVTPWSLKEELAVDTLAARIESISRRVRRGQIDLSNNWISSLVKGSVTRFSDVERVAKSFTSGKMSDAIIELIAPLLFPRTSDKNVLGVKEGDLSLWLAVVTGMPGVTSLSAHALKNGIPYPTGFPLQTFIQEIFLIVWSRLLISYDIASANTRLLASWMATLNSIRRALASNVGPIGFEVTSLLTSWVLHKRVSREMEQINRVMQSIIQLFGQFPTPSGGIPSTLPASLGSPTLLKILSQILEFGLDAPTPCRLGFRTVQPSELEGWRQYHKALDISELIKSASPSQLAKGEIPVTESLGMGNARIPSPLIHMRAEFTEVNLPTTLKRLEEGVIPAFDLNSVILILKEYLYRCYIPSQLPDFPTVSEFVLDPDMPPSEKASLWENPMLLPSFRTVLSDDSYGQAVAEAQTWFKKSQFRSDPLPPVLTKHNAVLSPFFMKEVNKTSFGLSKPGKAFNRTIELMIQSRGLVQGEDGVKV